MQNDNTDAQTAEHVPKSPPKAPPAGELKALPRLPILVARGVLHVGEGARYGNAALYAYNLTNVLIEIDVDRSETVRVFDGAGNQICEAVWFAPTGRWGTANATRKAACQAFIAFHQRIAEHDALQKEAA